LVLRHPYVIAEYVRRYHEERKRLTATADAKRSRLQRQLGELTGKVDRLVEAIAKGHGDPAVLGPRATALHEERKRIVAELEAAPPLTEVITLHPAVLARYEEQLTHLQEVLDRGVRAGDSESAEAVRDLVETVTVFRDPSKSGGIEVEIVGRLTALLGEKTYPNGVRGVWGKMVAEEGLEPPTPRLPSVVCCYPKCYPRHQHASSPRRPLRVQSVDSDMK
jgi:hypothetical protein